MPSTTSYARWRSRSDAPLTAPSSPRRHNGPAGYRDAWHYHVYVFPRYPTPISTPPVTSPLLRRAIALHPKAERLLHDTPLTYSGTAAGPWIATGTATAAETETAN